MEVKQKLKALIIEQLKVSEEEVKPEANFINDLGADSLDMVELCMAIEDEFGIEIPDEELENLNTVSEVVEYIKKKKLV